ncbi:MAG: hypothetical protein MRY49_03505 [Candidatus Pacebacteria bacterium]|nr:hypothetical protein [Candidatus Paceibacterota bacterium]
MDDLNKQQLILLVILVAFVVSIATGIITTSLLSKAPVEVTRTINQVVERTVETVVPNDIDSEKEVVTVKETVVVTEEDRVIEAIEKNKSKVVRVFEEGVFRGIGFLKGDTEIATVGPIFNGSGNYKARFDGGEEVDVNFDRRDDVGVVYLKVQTEGKNYENASLSSEDLKLGQRVIVIYGINQAISTGLVSSITGDSRVITSIDTTNMENGSILLNLSGEIVGVLSSTKEFVSSKKLFVSADTSNTAAVGESI